MTPSDPSTPETPIVPQRALVFWVIWSALLVGVVVLQVTLGGGFPSGRNPPGASLNPILWVGLALVIAATAVRWVILPRFTTLAQKLVAMIVGLALSEAATFLSIFLLRNQPETQLALLLAGFIGMVQFAPIYANEERR